MSTCGHCTTGIWHLESRTASVTPVWMLLALGKVLGCALLLVTLTILLLTLTRSALFAVLAAVGAWHVSNLLFALAAQLLFISRDPPK
jgi:hypothetical protein